MRLSQAPYPHAGRLIEFILLFLGLPAVLFFHTTRWNVHVCLWIASIYALILIRREGHIRWSELWNGAGWTKKDRKAAFLRFCVATLVIVLATAYTLPERLFSFPMQRPLFWLLVMALYPILSALPQELVFRSFFFRRYKDIFQGNNALILASAICFALAHVVIGNFVAPPLCFVGGLLFAYSYSQHRSLKWAAIEHAAYGCMVFTAGIGTYFLVGGGIHH